MSRRFTHAGFTLIELIAVVAVVLILVLIAVVRVGNVRASAYDTTARVLEKEFSKGVEQLVARGTAVIGSLQLAASAGTFLSTTPADPNYMGMESTVYRISSPSTVNASAVANVLTQLDDLLKAHGAGLIRGSVGPEILSLYNVDIVVTKDGGGNARNIFLKLSTP